MQTDGSRLTEDTCGGWLLVRHLQLNPVPGDGTFPSFHMRLSGRGARARARDIASWALVEGCQAEKGYNLRIIFHSRAVASPGAEAAARQPDSQADATLVVEIKD